MAKYNPHSFYCLKCGNRALTLQRPDSRKREKFHRKKLYCYHCKQEINCIECKNDNEVYEFKQAFNNGEYKEEAQISLQHILKEAVI